MKNIYLFLFSFLLSIYGFSAIAQPTITTYDPTQNATDVAVDKTLVLTFDQNIKFNDDGSRYYVEIYDGDDNFIKDYQIRNGSADPELSISGTQLSINPEFDLDGSTTYYILIDPSALLATSDNSAFAGITSSTQWRFTTAAPDVYITDYNPDQDASNVPINQDLVLTFNTNIKFNSSSTRYYIEIWDPSINDIFEDYEIRYGDADANVTISGNQLTINPTSNFEGNKTYYILIDANGIQSDPDGINFGGISSDTEWRFTTTSSAPSITAYDPTQNSTTALVDQNLVLTFSEDIAFNSSSTRYYVEIFKSDGTSVEDWQIRNSGADAGLTISNDQLIIDPSSDLDYETSYYVLIDADGIVSSSSGVGFPGLSGSSDWAFTTVKEEIPTLNPENGATGVSRTPTLTATFSGNVAFGDNYTLRVFRVGDITNNPIELATGYNDGGFITGRDSRLTISQDGLSFSIDLSDDLLDGNIKYGVYVPTDALTIDGTPYNGFNDANNPNWAFTTATNPPPPVVQTYIPEQNATGVPIKQTLSLTFDRDIQANQSSTNTYLRLYKNGNATPVLECLFRLGSIESGKGVSITDNVLTIDPTFDLDANSDYYVTIDAGTIESLFGEPFEGIDNSSTKWSFQTEIPPVIDSYDPIQDATEVAVNKTITLTFDKNIVPNQGNDLYYIKIFDSSDSQNPFLSIYSQGGVLESGKGASISGNVLTIDPPSDFLASKTYYMIIDYGAIEGADGTHFLGIDNVNTIYQFSTVTNPPAVVSFDPAQDAIEVPVDKVFTIEFDKNIQANSSTSNRYLYLYETGNPTFIYQYTFQGSGISPAGITISGSTMTIDFPADLNFNTEYYYTIDAGAVESASTGDPFGGIDNSESNNWKFKTIAPPEWTNDYPVITDQTEDDMILRGMTQKGGNYYYVVTSSSTAPSEDQIVSGVDENGDPAAINGNGSMTADTEFSSTIDITGLTVATQYYLYVVAQENVYNLYSLIEQLPFTRNLINTWTGNVDSDFGNIDNWSGSSYVINGSILIPSSSKNFPVITGNKQVFNVEVEAGAQLTIDDNSTLTATGDLDLYSSTTLNASLLNKGTLTVNGETRVHQIVTANDRSYYVCSPVSGATGYSIGADIGVYYWENSANNWVAYDATSAFQPARGYVVRSNNSELLFTGDLNNADVTIGVERRNDDDGEGWNLIGNPYPSAVDWDLVPTKQNILNGFWVFLNDQSQYGAYNGASSTAVNIENSVIPSNHALWVKVFIGNTTGQVVFDNSVRVHNNTTYLKKATLSTNPTLKIAGVNGTYRDEIAVVFNEDATSDLDEFDSEKKFSNNSNFVQLFTNVNTTELCINGLPPYSNDYTIPLSVKIGNPGTFTIEKVEYSNFPDNGTVLLEDMQENKIVDLITDGSYTFTSSQTGDITDRFQLTFKGDLSTAVSPRVQDEQLTKIYSYNKTIAIKVQDISDARYMIYAINGQLIKEGIVGPNTTSKVSIGKTGLYIVKVVYSGGVESQKVIIK